MKENPQMLERTVPNRWWFSRIAAVNSKYLCVFSSPLCLPYIYFNLGLESQWR